MEEDITSVLGAAGGERSEPFACMVYHTSYCVPHDNIIITRLFELVVGMLYT